MIPEDRNDTKEDQLDDEYPDNSEHLESEESDEGEEAEKPSSTDGPLVTEAVEESLFEDVTHTKMARYTMQSDVFKYNNKFKSREQFKVLKYTDAVYRGIIDEETGKRQEKGIMVYENGRVYEGFWHMD